MNKFLFLLAQISKGKSPLRAFMNMEFVGLKLEGSIVDVGGGRNPDYFSYAKLDVGSHVEPIDMSLNPINFERDPLPYGDNSIDTVVCCNLLEHIYNHGFLTDEMYRILKTDGKLIGFVPFFIQYHPDPHDYFRYTKESLAILFEKAGFKKVNIRALGHGPFIVHANNIIVSLPTIVRLPLFILYYISDLLWIRVSKRNKNNFPLGYFFELSKND